MPMAVSSRPRAGRCRCSMSRRSRGCGAPIPVPRRPRRSTGRSAISSNCSVPTAASGCGAIPATPCRGSTPMPPTFCCAPRSTARTSLISRSNRPSAGCTITSARSTPKSATCRRWPMPTTCWPGPNQTISVSCVISTIRKWRGSQHSSPRRRSPPHWRNMAMRRAPLPPMTRRSSPGRRALPRSATSITAANCATAPPCSPLRPPIRAIRPA